MSDHVKAFESLGTYMERGKGEGGIGITYAVLVFLPRLVLHRVVSYELQHS